MYTRQNKILICFLLLLFSLSLQSYNIFRGDREGIIEKSKLKEKLKSADSDDSDDPQLTTTTLQINNPGSDYYIIGTSLTVQGTAGGNIDKVQVKLDNTSWIDTSGEENWQYTYSFIEIGPHTIYARVKYENKYYSEKSVSFNIGRAFGTVNRDIGYSLDIVSDGGYIIAGEICSSNTSYKDIYLIKTDSNGYTNWTRIIDTGNDHESASSIQQTSDGGYIFVGTRGNFITSSQDIQLIKTDANGNTNWRKIYGGGQNDSSYSCQQTSDNGYIIAGDTESFSIDYDAYLIKTDTSGNVTWSNTYGGGNNDGVDSVQQTTDGGYILAGGTRSFGAGERDVYLIKTDSSGNTNWTKVIGGSKNDYANSIKQTTDGGYICVGSTSSFSGNGTGDIYLIKTDANGNTNWTKCYNIIDHDYGNDVQQTSDGGFIITGSCNKAGGTMILLKTDSNGNTSWIKIIDSAKKGYCIKQTSDGGYIITGYTFLGAGMYDTCLIKTDSNGN